MVKTVLVGAGDITGVVTVKIKKSFVTNVPSLTEIVTATTPVWAPGSIVIGPFITCAAKY